MQNRNYILITPLKDEEKTISLVISSVLNQTIKPRLWVIINDNSKDNSLRIIKEKTKKIEWIKVITKKINREYNWFGYSKVINEGINYCIYRNLFHFLDINYLAILDSDTIVDPNYFEKLIDGFLKDNLIGVLSGKMYLKNKKKWQLEKSKRVVGPARMYRINILEKIGYFPKTPSPDTVSDIKIKNKGYKMFSINDVRAFHYRASLNKENSSLKGYFIFGRSRYILSAPFIFITIISFKISFTKKPFIISGILFFLGYITGFFTKEKRIYDKEVVIYWKSFWKRII